MRVLMISKTAIGAAYRRKLAPLVQQGVELMVVVPPYWRDDAGLRVLLERSADTGLTLAVEPMALNGHFHVHFYPLLSRRLRQFRPHLVHVDEEPYNFATLHAFVLAHRVGAQTLFFTWQNIAKRYPPPFSWMERYCYRRAAGAIAGNADAARVLQGKGYAGPLWTIPHYSVGLDPAVFYRRATPTEPQRPFTVGWFSGRLREFKGVHLLLQAVAALQDDTRVEIAGWGPEATRLQALAAQLGLEGRFQIHGRIASDQIPAFASRLDVAVMPSLSTPQWKEQFGRMLVEAMACEVPVVGSDSGEIPHVIGDAGLIFPEGDVQALAGCLRRLRDDPGLRRELAARGLTRVRSRYTQDQIAAQTVAVYRQILGWGQGSGPADP